MPVYVLQEGRSNIFKIGVTSGTDIDRRRRQLNSGNPQGLRPFQVIDLEPAREAESLFQPRQVHPNVPGHGGKEFFEMQSENHMRCSWNMPLRCSGDTRLLSRASMRLSGG